jgi:beta-phosphoglucomutase-like phosphatase (HAD superfamily)
VLVDSEALLKQGEVEALQAAGFDDVTVEDCVRLFSGVSVDKAQANFEAEYKKSLPDNFFPEQIAGSIQLFRDRLMPLNDKTVLSLHEKKIPMCVASGSPRNRV